MLTEAALAEAVLAETVFVTGRAALGWAVPEVVLEWLVLYAAGAAFAELVLAVAEWVPLELESLELVPAAAEPDCPESACEAVLMAEPAAELAVETGESGGGSVAACACRENTSMMMKIPAAAIASCIAR